MDAIELLRGANDRRTNAPQNPSEFARIATSSSAQLA
jgi:hypothetical protein